MSKLKGEHWWPLFNDVLALEDVVDHHQYDIATDDLLRAHDAMVKLKAFVVLLPEEIVQTITSSKEYSVYVEWDANQWSVAFCDWCFTLAKSSDR